MKDKEVESLLTVEEIRAYCSRLFEIQVEHVTNKRLALNFVRSFIKTDNLSIDSNFAIISFIGISNILESCWFSLYSSLYGNPKDVS